jgi:hypothetical protein
MMKQVFGFPVYITNIDEKLYNKKEIINDIGYNFKKDKTRNSWENANQYKKSNLHHNYGDYNNKNFKQLNYESLIPIYEKKITDFLNSLHFTRPVNFKFNIVNYTCMTSSQYMKSHYHPDTDFTAVHYLSFDKKFHKPTLFENTNNFSEYTKTLRPHLNNLFDKNDLQHSWYYDCWSFDTKEDDLCITPAFLYHSVPNQNLSKKLRITIVLNITIE